MKYYISLSNEVNDFLADKNICLPKNNEMRKYDFVLWIRENFFYYDNNNEDNNNELFETFGKYVFTYKKQNSIWFLDIENKDGKFFFFDYGIYFLNEVDLMTYRMKFL